MTSQALAAASIARVGARVVAPFDAQHDDSEKHTDHGEVMEVNRFAPVALVRFDCGCRSYVPLRRLKLDLNPRPLAPQAAARRAVVRPESSPDALAGPPPRSPGARVLDIDDPGNPGGPVSPLRGADRPSTPPAPDAAATAPRRGERRPPMAARPARPAGGTGTPPPSRRELTWPRERILEKIRAWAADHDGYGPTAKAWRQPDSGDHPATSHVIRVFGSWLEAIKQAGVRPAPRGAPPRTPRIWQPEAILGAMRDDAQRLGRTPLCEEWKAARRGVAPSANTVFRVFGSWENALTAAGLEHNKRGRKPRLR